MNIKLLAIAVVLALGLSVVAVSKSSQIVERQVGSVVSPLVNEALFLFGGHADARINATSSSVATYTLVANDLGASGVFFDTISFSKTGAVATTTWTLPASSTVSFLPQNGMRGIICFEVATSSEANPGLTLAAGTGWQIGTASTTPTGLTINGGQLACGHVLRSFDSDLILDIVNFKDAH